MANEFKQHLEAKELSEKTIKQYLIFYRLFNKECAKINQNSINRFVKNHKGFIVRSFLKNLFEFLSEQGIDERELPKIPKITGRNKRLKKDPVDLKDLKKIRSYLVDKKNYKFVLMFDLSFYCGLRREEITTIKMDDFYWDIWQEGKALRLKVFSKGKERIVIVPKKLAVRIVKNIDLAQSERFFGVGITRWHKVFKDAVKETTDKKITLHDLRRKRATLWLDQGVDLDEVRRRLGHSDISTTQRYIIRDEENRLEKWEND